ncbi:MAG: hypothetical protein Fur0022_28710 [Anaerolineales bacterium]
MISRASFLSFFLAFLMLLTACAPEENFGLPTPIPTEYLPTSIALTVAANLFAELPSASPNEPTNQPANRPSSTPTLTPTPTETPTPTITFTPSITPTPSNTPVPNVPLSEIEIRTPGSLSKVVSPIPVRAFVVPGNLGRVTVELLGEDGRLITRQIVTLGASPGNKAGLALDLPFNISGVSELGRLQIFTADEFNRPQAMVSVDVILLSTGTADLNIPTDFLAHVSIKDPQEGDLIQGGTVVVSGVARPTTDQSFLAELINESGQVVGQRLFDADPGLLTEFRPFFVEIPYTVTEPTQVRLIIYERTERIPGTIYLVSMEILISP